VKLVPGKFDLRFTGILPVDPLAECVSLKSSIAQLGKQIATLDKRILQAEELDQALLLASLKDQRAQFQSQVVAKQNRAAALGCP
jgi:hypothetical protein